MIYCLYLWLSSYFSNDEYVLNILTFYALYTHSHIHINIYIVYIYMYIYVYSLFMYLYIYYWTDWTELTELNWRKELQTDI